MRITDRQVQHYRTHGYVLVPRFLSEPELGAARENLFRYYPAPEELSATPERYGGLLEEPEQLQNEFPFAGEALNDLSTHPELIAFVERVLGSADVVLSQAAIWAKYAGTGDFDQGMHLDYQGNTLVVPRDDGAFRQVNMILYYSEVTADMGPTCVVSKQRTKGLPLWPTFRTRKKDPQIYQREKKILAPAGSLLVFGMATFHRASQMTAEFGARFSHHFVWRCGKYGFQGYQQWSSRGEKQALQDFLQRATPRQREVLGFPPPGHEYWTAETIKAVAMRYPGMEMAPYREGLRQKRV